MKGVYWVLRSEKDLGERERKRDRERKFYESDILLRPKRLKIQL
jgi:hypothetical protein